MTAIVLFVILRHHLHVHNTLIMQIYKRSNQLILFLLVDFLLLTFHSFDLLLYFFDLIHEFAWILLEFASCDTGQSLIQINRILIECILFIPFFILSKLQSHLFNSIIQFLHLQSWYLCYYISFVHIFQWLLICFIRDFSQTIISLVVYYGIIRQVRYFFESALCIVRCQLAQRINSSCIIDVVLFSHAQKLEEIQFIDNISIIISTAMSCKKQSSISDQKGLQMHQERQKMTNFLFDTISENLSLISKELIVQKFQKKMKVQVSELQPYMSPQFGFIDPDFHHNYTSINFQEQEQNVEISWIPAEELSEECSYSNQITALDELLFCNKSIDYALMVINWFARDIFLSIFTLQLSKMHLYAFDLMIDGTFVRIAIDSYVPVHGVTNEPLFAKAFKGSIFPCIIEKLLAKVYGDYTSITGEFIDIVEMFTYFCREEISCTQGITQQILVDIIQRKLSEDSIVCFRTRNSIRLQSFGLESNHVYIILKIIQTQSDILIEFLQLEGSNWIGKYSKLRSNWRADLAQLASSNEIILEQTQKQNYMSLSDLKGISRELVVLNNTLQFHKNYLVCEKYNSCLTMYELRTDKVNQLQLRTSFRQKKCYNSILVIQRQSKKLATSVPSYNLVASSFHQNKSNNYLQCQIAPGTYWIVVYNTHPQENVLPYHLTVFLSNNFPELRQSQNQLQALNVLEGAFHNYFNNVYTESKQPVILKHLYESTGLAFIYVRPNENVIEVTLQLQKLKSSKIFPLNIPQLEKDFFKQQFRLQKVLCFYCQWSKKQNIEFQQQKVEDQILKKVAFPPLSSVKVKIKRQNIQYLKHSY